jgi:hypothetical protein
MITYASGTAVVGHIIIYQGDVVVATNVITIGSLNLSNNNDLVISLTIENVGDSLPVRSCNVRANSIGTNNWTMGM